MPNVLSDKDITELREVFEILYLLMHRNKNQHRLTHWWKWISMLRRHLTKLLQEATAREHIKCAARVEYLRDLLIPKCHRALTNVVADSQFSVLGLVLLANVARINRIVRGDHLQPEAETREGFISIKTGVEPSSIAREDSGEAIERDSTYEAASSSSDLALGRICGLGVGEIGKTKAERRDEGIEKAKGAMMTLQRAPRRKPKSADAIDELFRGLS
ncbi:MAG: hypothetical protein M1827_005686 [Pycnora praestabilis]|nr:MAG: hypothetical protein M1827_005686 [Pycnora praestabilis]